MRRGKGQERRGEKKERLWESLGDVWALFFQWDCVCCSVALGTFKRGLGRENNDGKTEKKMDLCKVPGVKFLWNKNLSVFFFSISNFSHCFLFFSGVLVNGHLYVNMKNQDQVLIDGLLENHVGLAFV